MINKSGFSGQVALQLALEYFRLSSNHMVGTKDLYQENMRGQRGTPLIMAL